MEIESKYHIQLLEKLPLLLTLLVEFNCECSLIRKSNLQEKSVLKELNLTLGVIIFLSELNFENVYCFGV